MSRKSLIATSAIALCSALILGAVAPAYARGGGGGGNDAYQSSLDEQYARNHPTIVPGTPPGLSTPDSAYGFAPGARGSFAYQHAPHAPRTREAR
jgi:hypothetical protein